MEDKELEEAFHKVLDDDDYNEFFNVHRYFGWKKDLEYLWEKEILNKEQFFHRFCPFEGGKDGDAVIEIWDRKLVRKGVDDWEEKM